MLKRDSLFTEPDETHEGPPKMNDFTSFTECNSDFYFECDYFKEYVMSGCCHGEIHNEKHNESSGIILDNQFFLNRNYNNKYWCLSSI